ncbi:MAG: hypothetical protein LBD74_00235 [Spirochaetaceae bacterium]|jgi:hypothetical protein|nr:hypothetical protein [Spirochaetaceae bacterium]
MMQRFLGKLLVFGFLFLLGILGLLLLPLPSHTYNLAILDKHRLLEGMGSPKLVIAGGSNCAFGIDSQALTEALGIPVFNLGIHAGFGLGRILDDAGRFLHAGDVLLVIPEYSHFTDAWNGGEAAYGLIFNARQYRLLLHPGLYGLPGELPSCIVTHLQGFIARFRPPNPLAYRRDGFNQYGDYIDHLDRENQAFASRLALSRLDQKALNRFFRFVESCEAQGIRVILSYPSYEEASFAASTDLIRTLDGILREQIAVISRPETYCFPRDWFYDTAYHLNREGRQQRTEALLRDIARSGLFSTSP